MVLRALQQYTISYRFNDDRVGLQSTSITK